MSTDVTDSWMTRSPSCYYSMHTSDYSASLRAVQPWTGENINVLCQAQQVIKIIWHKTAMPPQTDGSIVFARWRQCAFPCGHIGATWRIRLNLCFLRSNRVHNSVHPFFHSSRRQSTYLQWVLLPPKLPFAMGDLHPYLIHGSLDSHPSPQPRRHLDRFSHFAGLTTVTDRQTDRQTTILGR